MGSKLHLLFGVLVLGSSLGEQYTRRWDPYTTTTERYPGWRPGSGDDDYSDDGGCRDCHDHGVEPRNGMPNINVGSHSQITLVKAFIIGDAGGWEFSKGSGYGSFYSGGGKDKDDGSHGSWDDKNDRGSRPPWGAKPRGSRGGKFGSIISDIFKDIFSNEGRSGVDFMSRGVGRRRPSFPHFGFFQPGPCPEVKPVRTNTSLENILGTWHTSGSTLAFLQSMVDCSEAELTWNAENNAINIQANATLFSRIPRSMSLVATLNDQGEMEVSPEGKEGIKMVVKNIGTDNENYAVLYSCRETRNHHKESAFLVTREANGFPTYGEKASEDLRSAGVDKKLFALSCKREGPTRN